LEFLKKIKDAVEKIMDMTIKESELFLLNQIMEIFYKDFNSLRAKNHLGIEILI